ncbi:CDP-glycerol glycerophosphotransferase family protein [Candidatus Berkiella aquae]|uniref:CDP-Glycerol:Poly(Glycerophosphate) glycerophosphotransferase n=1 Tax=Candidatus Berkiella aquae TaxID=295108 RepID=A0A0Q9YKK9_9GAMM|nr:CDP-glycerol glycerophosphotransferase family protein [Candidatus Berkiella aquae]MCS5712319.1 CDP-glycerol glycerophosphotransferase family protein [Candidatus Berkiella aquae]
MRRLYNYFKEIVALLQHLPLLWQMMQEKRQGRKIVAYQLSSAGQLQYMLPFHQELQKKITHVSYYVSMDYPMHGKLGDINIAPSHYFPSKIAKYLFPIDVFLEAEIHSRGPKNAVKIFSGHGQANKLSHWADDNLKAFDIYFMHGPLERKMFEVIQESKPQVTNHIKLINVGYPKLDDLVNGNYDRIELMTKLGLDPNLKTVLYAPAWDPGGSLRTYGTQIAEMLLSIPDINLIVKLHPASMEPENSPYFDFYTGGKRWEQEFAKIQNPRCRFVKDYLINPYLHISDLMVNDFSGVGLEFMVLNRPVIYIDCPEYFEKILPSWHCDGHLAKTDDRFNGGRNAGTVVHNLEELKSQVEQQLKEPDIHSAKRKELAAQLMYNPGHGAAVGTAEILKILECA